MPTRRSAERFFFSPSFPFSPFSPVFSISSPATDGEREVRVAEGFRVAKGFGDFGEGREVDRFQELGEAFVVSGDKAQEFRGAVGGLEDGAEIGVVRGAGGFGHDVPRFCGLSPWKILFL